MSHDDIFDAMGHAERAGRSGSSLFLVDQRTGQVTRVEATRSQAIHSFNAALCGHLLIALAAACCLLHIALRGFDYLPFCGLLCTVITWAAAHMASGVASATPDGEDDGALYVVCAVLAVMSVMFGIASIWSL